MHHGVNGILLMARISDIKNQVDIVDWIVYEQTKDVKVDKNFSEILT